MQAKDIRPDGQNQVERNGVVIRKGSVGAFLANARIWCDPDADVALRVIAEKDIIDGLPALRELGLFELLSVRNAALERLIDAH